MNKTPKLRFKAFSGDWESKYGESIAEKITKGSSPKWQGFNYQSEGVLFVTSENVRDGYLDISEPKYLPLEFNEKQKSSSLVKGDILINIVGASIGRICEFDLDNVIANVNQAVCVLRLKDKTMKNIINYHLQTDKIKKVLFGTQTESARPNLSLADIRGLEFNLPKTKEEQEKIASFFSLIDDKISLQGEKVKALKDYKTGMMQKIFSRELRFKDDDGRDYPDWEEKSFDELYSSISTKPYQIKSSEVESSGEFEVVDQGKENICGYTNNQEKVFYNTPIIIYGDHTTNIKFRDVKFVVGADGTKLLCNKNNYNDMKFLFFALEFNNIEPEGYKRHFSILKQISFTIPTSKEEQVKISTVISSLESKIGREQEKLDSLNKYKKGLLQQMFV